jgi:hypothetical protein
MQYSRYVSALLALFTISGCGIYLKAPNIEEVDIAADPGTSFIVGSVTQSSDGDPAPFDDRVAFYFRKKDGSRRFRLESAEIIRPVMGPPNKALADRGLEEQHGTLFAVQLQPGIYQLVRFAIEWPSQQNVNFSDPIEFELLPGEVIYLGNLDARFCVRHAYANQYGVSGVIVSVTDHMSRDAPFLRDKFIALQQASMTRKVISNAELQERAGFLRNGCG